MDALRSAGPALLFGLRLWAAVCFALYVAYALELDDAHWAGTSAAIVCQPSLGTALRKGSFRMVGTAVGAVAIVVLTACFPQSRTGFLLGLALWCAACGMVATILHNFAAYAAALAGYTAAIIASSTLGATGSENGGEVFIVAVTRATEICIGIVCAGIVLAGTDFGGALQKLAAQLTAISTEIARRLTGTFVLDAAEQADTRPVRRELIRRVAALSPVIDEAIGEFSDLRYRSGAFQAAVDGLFDALSGWRAVAQHLERLPNDRGRREADIVLRLLPHELRSGPMQGEATIWADPSRGRQAFDAAVRALIALRAETASLRLLADQTAGALVGISRALDALAMMADPRHAARLSRAARLRAPDFLPSFVNAGRVFVTIGAVELFWVATAWPSGALAITFAAIAVILLSPRDDQAYTAAIGFLLGTGVTVALAGVTEFAVLPGAEVDTFVGLAIAIGLVLVPLGTLAARPWKRPLFMIMFSIMTANFIPLLAPENQMTYDTQAFYNSSLAIVVGVSIAALAFRLLPPLSPAVRTHRLLFLTLRDLRRLATGPIPRTPHDWESRAYGRLAALPVQAAPVQSARLLAACSVGVLIIRLRRSAHRFHVSVELDAALDSVGHGDSATAIERLARLDRTLGATSNTRPGAAVALRAQGYVRAISETLVHHHAYFDAAAPP